MWDIYTFVIGDEYKGLGLDRHIHRLINDAKEVLNLKLTKADILEKLLADTNLTPNSVCRITVYPKHFSLNTPFSDNRAEILITTRSIDNQGYIKPIALKTFDYVRELAQHKNIQFA